MHSCARPYVQHWLKLHALQDASSAAANAARNIWDPFDYGMCAIHAMKIWQERSHKAITTDIAGIFNDDFEKFKNCPVLELITSRTLLEKMLIKWR